MRRSLRAMYFLPFTLFLMGFETSTVEFPTGATYSWDKDRQMVGGLLFRPSAEGTAPAVVLLHTCEGLLPHVTIDWPKFLTSLGYVVLSIDSYTPRGYAQCTERGTFKNDQTKDAFGALDYLAGLPFVDSQRIAVMGFSAGAFAINDLVISRSRQRKGMRNFTAAISLYGRCDVPLQAYTERDIPLMQVIGERDVFHDICTGDWMSDRPIQVHVLKGAHHAFDHRQITSKRLAPKFWFPDAQDNPMLYDAASTRQAQELVRAFLTEHL